MSKFSLFKEHPLFLPDMKEQCDPIYNWQQKYDAGDLIDCIIWVSNQDPTESDRESG